MSKGENDFSCSISHIPNIFRAAGFAELIFQRGGERVINAS
jgi:hypothetical protein